MTSDLPVPDLHLANKILSTVAYPRRLRVGKLRPPIGMLRFDVRSLSELHLHLAPDDRSLPGIALKALVEWIRIEISDEDLSLRIREDLAKSPSYAAACVKVYDLVGRRLVQARRVAGKEEVS